VRGATRAVRLGAVRSITLYNGGAGLFLIVFALSGRAFALSGRAFGIVLWLFALIHLVHALLFAFTLARPASGPGKTEA